MRESLVFPARGCPIESVRRLSTFRLGVHLALCVAIFSCKPNHNNLADGSADANQLDRYLAKSPPNGPAPTGLEPSTWATHLHDDLLPFWEMPSARGAPVGNFPTFRDMNGNPTQRTERFTRMMGRQIYAYSMSYLMTGDPALLKLARAGKEWLLEHARDKARGGWNARLTVDGQSAGDDTKWAQDAAYVAMGPAAYFFVTGDADSEAAILATRDELFDSAKFWDAKNRRIKDGLNAQMTTEMFVGPSTSWELVAQLDPISAFLLLVQPVLTESTRRDQVLADLNVLGQTIEDSFFKDGFFWGSTGSLGVFNSFHSDFGHMLKTHWVLTQIDKRVVTRPFSTFLETHTEATLKMAFDTDRERWAKLPTSKTTVQYGSDWWSYAEADQLAAVLALSGDEVWLHNLAKTSSHFRAEYVDRKRPSRELVSSINREGAWVFPWPDSDTAKCNEWKNGFHSVEHALVMSLISHWASRTPLPLYFAFPSGKVDEFARRATPYVFAGRVAKVEDLGPLDEFAGMNKVRVTFDELR